MNEPRLRFKSFNDDWKKNYVRTVLSYKNGYALEKKSSSNGKYNIINLSSISSDGNLKDSHKRYDDDDIETLHKNDLVMILSFHPGGIIGINAIIPKNNKYVLNQRVGLLRVNSNNNHIFIHYALNLNRKKLEMLANGLAQLNLSKNDILDLCIFTPVLKEQIKIGSFFSNLDNQIKLQLDKLENLKRDKKGYLQKMFPSDDNKPKLRLKGFNDDWKTRKLGETLKVGKSGGTPSTKNHAYYNGTIPFLSIKDITNSENGVINSTYNSITDSGLKNSSAWIVPKGSVTVSMYASVGKVAKINIDLATSQAFFNMVYRNEYDLNFMYYLLQNINANNRWKPLISTGTQQNLNAQKIRNLSIKVPTYLEQEKIGMFFDNLDKQIELQQQKVIHLKRLKKAYLQKMFI